MDVDKDGFNNLGELDHVLENVTAVPCLLSVDVAPFMAFGLKVQRCSSFFV